MIEENLFEIFSRFPTQKHVIEICKPGQEEKTCRYLTIGSGLECLKTNNLRKVIDKRVENNEMNEKGDNCEGLLGLIIEEQERLRGKEADYTRPYSTITSRFKKIEIEDNTLKVIMDWKNKKGVEEGVEFEFEINDLNITVNSKSVILFQNLDLGENFIKRITISF